MITGSKVTEFFCIADDFCKEFEAEVVKKALPSSPDAPKRRRKRMMSDLEVITILICFHFNTYRNFMHYYLSCVCGQWRHLFPRRFSYNRLVEVMPRCFVALTMSLRLACFGKCTGISFVDSTCIPVIHHNFIMNLLAAIGAYCFYATKPEVNFDFEVSEADGQLVIWQ